MPGYEDRLTAAKAEMVAAWEAGDADAFVAAQARAEHFETLTWALQEARVFDARLHPRDRLGRFVEVLRLLRAMTPKARREADREAFRAAFEGHVAREKERAKKKQDAFGPDGIASLARLHADQDLRFRRDYYRHQKKKNDPRFRAGRFAPTA